MTTGPHRDSPAGPPPASALAPRSGQATRRTTPAPHPQASGCAADNIKSEELLDGIYVIRTSEPTERLAAPDGVRSYKRLALVEQAFRCFKGIDLLVRPIHHRTADWVRAHILLCLLTYYVEWHLRQVWEPLLFEDEELTENRRRCDPVAPAQASESVRLKKKTHRTAGDLPVQSFRTLLAHLGTRCRNTCLVTGDPKQTETVASLPGPIRRSLGRNRENRLGTRSMPPSWPPTRRSA